MSRQGLFGLFILWGSCLAQAATVSMTLDRAGGVLMQKGQWYQFRLGELGLAFPAEVRSLSWQLESLGVWPQPPLIMLCRNNDCQPLSSVSGRSQRFSGWPSQGVWSISLQLPGKGAQQPPIYLNRMSLTINNSIAKSPVMDEEPHSPKLTKR